MTDQEAIARAQKELDNSTYLAETGRNNGLKTIHQKRVSWLVRVLRLARIALRDQEERENPKPMTRADRIRAVSDEDLAKIIYGIEQGYCANLPECGELLDSEGGIPEEKCIGCALAWLRQPAEN